jgi:hypothetical protein
MKKTVSFHRRQPKELSQVYIILREIVRLLGVLLIIICLFALVAYAKRLEKWQAAQIVDQQRS